MFEKKIDGGEGWSGSVGAEEGGLVAASRGNSDEKRELRMLSRPSEEDGMSWVLKASRKRVFATYELF